MKYCKEVKKERQMIQMRREEREKYINDWIIAGFMAVVIFGVFMSFF